MHTYVFLIHTTEDLPLNRRLLNFFFFSLILKEKVTMKVSHFIMKLIYLNKKFFKKVWVLLLFPCQCQYSANVNTPVHDISFTAQWAAVPLSDVVVKEHRGHSDQDAVVSQFLLKWEWVQVDSERGITVLKEKRRVNWHTDLQRTLDMNYSYNWQSDKPNYFILITSYIDLLLYNSWPG